MYVSVYVCTYVCMYAHTEIRMRRHTHTHVCVHARTACSWAAPDCDAIGLAPTELSLVGFYGYGFGV